MHIYRQNFTQFIVRTSFTDSFLLLNNSQILNVAKGVYVRDNIITFVCASVGLTRLAIARGGPSSE